MPFFFFFLKKKIIKKKSWHNDENSKLPCHRFTLLAERNIQRDDEAQFKAGNGVGCT